MSGNWAAGAQVIAVERFWLTNQQPGRKCASLQGLAKQEVQGLVEAVGKSVMPYMRSLDTCVIYIRVSPRLLLTEIRHKHRSYAKQLHFMLQEIVNLIIFILIFLISTFMETMKISILYEIPEVYFYKHYEN